MPLFSGYLSGYRTIVWFSCVSPLKVDGTKFWLPFIFFFFFRIAGLAFHDNTPICIVLGISSFPDFLLLFPVFFVISTSTLIYLFIWHFCRLLQCRIHLIVWACLYDKEKQALKQPTLERQTLEVLGLKLVHTHYWMFVNTRITPNCSWLCYNAL